MTHVSDIYAYGAAFTAIRPPGVLGFPLYVYDVVPTTINLSAIAANQGAVSGTLSSVVLTASTGATTTTINGSTCIDLGIARCVTISGTQSSTVAVNFILTGYEEIIYDDGTRGPGMLMTQAISGPTGTAAVSTTKAFRYIKAAQVTGNTVSGFSIGTTDTIGFPYRLLDAGEVILKYDGTQITSSAGFTAAVTAAATATTGDVRGTYSLQSASNSIKRYVAYIYPRDPNTHDGAYGVDQA